MNVRSRLLIALIVAVAGVMAATFSLRAAEVFPAEPAAPDAATLTIAHFAPFATEPVSTSVSIVVSSDTLTRTTVVTDFQFGERVVGAALPAGTYTVEVIPTGTITPAATFTATVEEGVDYTVAAIGGANGWPVEPYLLVNDSTPFTTTGKVRISHLAPFAASLDGTRVDICTDDGDVVPGLAGIPYKASTGYLSLPAGLYDLGIAVADTDCATVALDIPAFALRAGQVADIFAIGLVGEPGVQLQVVADGLTARVAVGHFAPFASDVISTSVSVKLDGATVLNDFVFGDLTGYIELAPGSYFAEIVPTGAASAAISGTVVIPSFTDFTLAAIGNGSLQPLGVLALEDDNVTAPPAGSARLRVTHAAPFAATLPGTSVDICATGVVTPVLGAVEYGDSALLDLPANVYDLFVSPAGGGCAAVLFDIPPVGLNAGQIAYVYAVGDVQNIAPTVVVTPDIVAQRRILPLVFNETPREMPTILEIAESNGNFTTLLAAIDAAGLTSALEGPGPFTVFAPTDAAFDALGAATVEALLQDPEGQLKQILLYHVLARWLNSSGLFTGLQVETLQGSPVTFTLEGGNPATIRVNDSLITVADIYAENGIVHVIDAVLLPPGE